MALSDVVHQILFIDTDNDGLTDGVEDLNRNDAVTVRSLMPATQIQMVMVFLMA